MENEENRAKEKGCWLLSLWLEHSSTVYTHTYTHIHFVEFGSLWNIRSKWKQNARWHFLLHRKSVYSMEMEMETNKINRIKWAFPWTRNIRWEKERTEGCIEICAISRFSWIFYWPWFCFYNFCEMKMPNKPFI